MSNSLPSRADACNMLGCADSELVDIFDAPAGVLYEMSDGNTFIDVSADNPDSDGKTGLMFAVAPAAPGGYKGDFPVFTNPPEEPARDLGIELLAMSKDELLAHARDLGIDVKGNWSKDRIAETIAAAVPESITPE